MHSSYIIFFDASCSFCQKCVAWICQVDQKKAFMLAPLNGSTFNQVFRGEGAFYCSLNSILLVETPVPKELKVKIRSKAIRKILWVLGGKYRLVVCVSLLLFGADFLYEWIASRRSKWTFKDPVAASLPEDRFLP